MAATSSAERATPAGTLTLRVEARDPQGSALGFTWSASLGTLGTPVNGASASEVAWTAPPCVSAGETPSIITPRREHTETLLPSGKVLVVGGGDTSEPLRSAELYEPATGTWSAAASPGQERRRHTATLLPSGKVLVAGGSPVDTARLYDPATDTWSEAGKLPLPPRSSATATLLRSGKVLLVGGDDGQGGRWSNLYDPATNTWSASEDIGSQRAYHTATLLRSGQVLVVGGYADGWALGMLYTP